MAPRFKKMMSHQQAATNLDEISLRPPSNSMVFKPVAAKPQVPMPPGTVTRLISNSDDKKQTSVKLMFRVSIKAGAIQRCSTWKILCLNVKFPSLQILFSVALF